MKPSFTRLYLALLLWVLCPALGWTQAPALYWQFNSTTPVADASGNGFVLNQNPPTTATVFLGGAVGDYWPVSDTTTSPAGIMDVLVPEIYDSTMFSFEMLFRPGMNFEDGYLIHWSGQFFIWIHSEGIQFYLTKSILSPAYVSFPFNGINRRDPLYWFNGDWHHLAFTYEAVSGELRLYLDGYSPPEFRAYIGSGSAINNPTGMQTIWLGTPIPGGAVRAMDYDEIAIYDTLLTEEMVWQHYQDFQLHNHYSATTSFTALDVPAFPCTETELNLMEFAEGFPNVLDSARDMQFHFPGSRHLPHHSFPPIRPYVVDAEVLSGIPASSLAWRAQTTADIFEDLALHYNYAFLLGRTHEAHNLTEFTSPDFYGFHSTQRAVTPGLIKKPRFLINYWSFAKPTDIGDPNLVAYFITDSILPWADMHYPPGNLFRWTTLSPLCNPSVANRLRTDGLTMRLYMERYSNAMFAAAGGGLGGTIARHIDVVAENDEIWQRVEEATVNGYAPTFADRFTAPCPPFASLVSTYEDYFSYRRHEQREFYRDIWRNYLDSINLAAPTDIVWYNVDDMHTAFYQYRQDREMNLGPYAQTHKPTPYFYPEGVSNWRWWYADKGSYERILVSRRGTTSIAGALGEFHYGDSLFQPFVSPGYSAPPASAVRDSFSLRPGQYLGLLKALAFLGADTYNHWDWQGGAPFNQPRWRTWKAVMPGYAQGVTTRMASFMYNGQPLPGDHIRYNPHYSFHAGDENNLILARKEHGADRYVLMGAIERSSNAKSAGDKYRDIRIQLNANPGVTKGFELQFGIREQGSTYVYDRTDTSNILFYQLDGWHEWKDPSRWCRDFMFECENPDSGLAGMTMRTETPAGVADGDYREFDTYLSYPGLVPLGPRLLYRFLQRSDGNMDVRAWVRARLRSSTASPGNVTVSMGGFTYLCPVTDTVFTWYHLDNSAIPAQMIFPTVTGQYHDLYVYLNNNRVQIDKVFLTHVDEDLFAFDLGTSIVVVNETRGGALNHFACVGDTVLFHTFNPLQEMCIDYYWTFGDGTVSYEAMPTHVYMEPGTYDVSLVVTELCTERSDTFNTTVIVKAPQVDAGDAFYFCAPDSVALTGLADSTALSVWWTPFPSVDPDSAYTTMAWADTTTYFVFHAVDDSGCVGIDSVRAEMLYVDVWADNQFNDLDDYDDIDTMFVCGDSAVPFFLQGHAWEVHWQPADMVSDSMGAWSVISDTLMPATIAGTDTLYEFTVIGHDSLHCSADTMLIRVIVYPALIAGINTMDTTICDTGAVTLSLDAFGPTPPAATYEWKPVDPLHIYVSGPLIPDPDVTFEFTTIFTLTVTDTNGCVVHDTLTVKRGLPKGILEDSVELKACYPDTFTFHAYGGGTYDWTPGTGLSDSTIADPTAVVSSPGTYTCTITDIYGCTLTDNVVVWADSCNWRPGVNYFLCSPTTSWMDANIFNTGGIVPIFTGYTFLIDGTMTFDISADFVNCKFYMAPYSTIYINPSKTARFTNCNFEAACDTIWEGIVIPNSTAQLRLFQGSSQDARYAVRSISGGKYNIDQFTFKRCQTGVYVQQYTTAAHTGRIVKTVFGEPGASPLTVVGAISPLMQYGVYIESNLNIRVGTDTAGLGNNFMGIHTGIYAHNTVLRVTNNSFDDILLAAGIANSGSAIKYRYSPALPPIPIIGMPTLTAGTGAAVYQHNTFYDCFRGIDAVGTVNITANYNYLERMSDRAFSATGNDKNTVSVQRNQMYDCGIGVYANNWKTVTGTINYNEIVNDIAPAIGIDFWSVIHLPGATYPVKVQQNTIKVCSLGVHLSFCNWVDVSDFNRIYIQPIAAPPNPIRDILVTEGKNIRIHENRLYGDVTGVWNTKGSTIYIGLEHYLSPFAIVSCNWFDKLGRGVIFNQASGGTTLRGNRFLGGVNAVMLFSSGFIGPQGAPGTPSANWWQPGGYTAGQTFVCASFSGSANKWYCTTGVPYYPSSNLFSCGSPSPNRVIPASAAGSPPGCSSFPIPPSARRQALEDMANGIIDYPIHPGESKWHQDFRLFDELAMDSVIRDTVPLLQTAFDTLALTVKSDVSRISTFVDMGDLATATIMNGALVPENTIEENAKLVNSIYFDVYSLADPILDSIQIATLLPIANECPVLGGPGVMTARTMLAEAGIYIRGQLECGGHEKMDGETADIQPSGLSARIFPNPSSEGFTVMTSEPLQDGGTVRIFDVRGVVKTEARFQPGEMTTEINCANWPSGIYLWKLDCGGSECATGKLIVQH